MTHNQIDYAKYLEDRRHNFATEGENVRHNTTVEQETSRHNVAEEHETKRHNIVNEVETNRHNVISETELNRHNVVTESESHRYNTEVIRHNQAAERLQAQSNALQAQANSINAQHYTRQDRQNANRVASEISVNNARISNIVAETQRAQAQTRQQQLESAAYTGDLFRQPRSSGHGFHSGSNLNGLAYAQYQSTLASTAQSQAVTDRTRVQSSSDIINSISNVINASGRLVGTLY